MNLRHIFILPALLAAMACSDDSPVTPDTPDTPEGPDITNSVEKLVSIDAGQTFQTIARLALRTVGRLPLWASHGLRTVRGLRNCFFLQRLWAASRKESAFPNGG